jgi:crotonobetainyl-CoA:carnitine CoA-transferase CaiB-like acyl-CoA transferase
MVRMPAFGLSGPWRNNIGFAQTMEQVAGLAWLTGHRSDQPRNQGGPSDPNAGMHAAFALLVGLAEREATQEGCHVEVTMVEGALNSAAEMVVEFSAYGHCLERDGNRSPNAAPQGLYPCRGFEEWLALSVTADHEWQALVGLIGPPECCDAEQFATYDGRRARHDELDEWIGAWTAERDARTASDLLIAAGIPAGIGRDPRSLLEHPQLQFRRFHETVDHPVVGSLAIPTVPFRFASVDRWIRSAAPLLGAHNHEILVEELGLEQQRFEALQAMGVIGNTPLMG